LREWVPESANVLITAAGNAAIEETDLRYLAELAESRRTKEITDSEYRALRSNAAQRVSADPKIPAGAQVTFTFTGSSSGRWPVECCHSTGHALDQLTLSAVSSMTNDVWYS
jgi:hypothetical protein